jgi:hypothetical protein
MRYGELRERLEAVPTDAEHGERSGDDFTLRSESAAARQRHRSPNRSGPGRLDWWLPAQPWFPT